MGYKTKSDCPWSPICITIHIDELDNNTPEQVGTQENDYADQVAERGLANETIDIIAPNIVRRISKAISLIAEEYMMQSELLTRAQLTERGGQLCAVSVMS